MPESWTLQQSDKVALGAGVRSLRLVALAGRVNLIGTDGPATLEVSRISGPPLYVERSDDGALVVRHGEYGKPPQLLRWLLGGGRTEVDLSLALPPDAVLDVKVLSGPVVVSNFHEGVSVKGATGEVTLAGVHGSARVTTVSGAITAEQVTGDLTVKAVSGAITVMAGAGGAIDLTAVSGAISVDLEDPVPSTVKLQCVSGAMTVRLPHDPDMSVDLGTGNGRAVSAFPQVRASGTRGSQKLAGTIGGGRATLVGKTLSGAVTLLRRSADADEDPWDLMFDDVPQDRTPTTPAPQDRATQDRAPQDQIPENQITDAGGTAPDGNGATPDNGENSEDAR